MIQAFSRTCLAGLVLVVTLSSCGGGGSSSTATGPNAPPSTPAAQPTPTPAPDPRDTLPPGPVLSYSIKLRSIESPLGEYRDVGQDPATGHWIVYKGDFVVFDSDQFNAAGEKCKWVSNPQWFIDGVDLPEQTLHPNGIVFRKGSSNPFLLRVDMADDGEFRLVGRVDGVDSESIVIESRRK